MTRIRQDILNQSVNVLKKLNVGSPKNSPRKVPWLGIIYISFNHLQLSNATTWALLVVYGVTGPYKWSF